MMIDMYDEKRLCEYPVEIIMKLIEVCGKEHLLESDVFNSTPLLVSIQYTAI
jgi:hypothetical protein